jgi:RNA polymerase sigma-54 factor
MTQKLVQAIRLLQMSALELQQTLKEELSVNPLLEEAEEEEQETREETSEERNGDDDGEFKAGEDEIDLDRYLRDGFEIGSRSSDEREEQEDFYERVPVSRQSLEEYLLSQLRISAESEEDVGIGEFIIGSLNKDGFLTLDVEKIAELQSAPVERVKAVLGLIQTFEPAGIAARDLRETLLIQLRQRGMEDTLAATLVGEHLDDLLNRRYPEIARKLKRSVREVQTAADLVSTLDPKPGSRYSTDEPKYIIPDLIVEKVDDDYVVQMNDRDIPRLRISSAYRRILREGERGSKSDREYVKDKIGKALWLIKTIDQRRQTMIKVMRAILEVQRDFFDKGVEYLKPLTLQEIAAMVGMHESTISRVTNGKYAQTPRGLFELKYFFSTGLRTNNGESASSRKIKFRIKELIDEEDPAKPLSDKRIEELLKEEGMIVARRTVAKYRDEMGLLSARKRKRY